MIEKLTSSMYLQFHGEAPPTTIKGVASTSNGEVNAVCGITFIGGEYFVVFGVKSGFNKRDILKGWKIFKKMLDSRKTYYALIDRDLDTAPSLLKHFGFNYFADDIYRYEG